jgi:hypothetical protein
MVSRPAKRVRTVCLSILNWQSTFRFQVQTVMTPRTMTIALRCEWERTRSVSIKESLLAYNQDDCVALKLLCLEIEKLIAESESRPDIDFAYMSGLINLIISRRSPFDIRAGESQSILLFKTGANRTLGLSLSAYLVRRLGKTPANERTFRNADTLFFN